MFIYIHSFYDNEILKEPHLNAFLNINAWGEEKREKKLCQMEYQFCLFMFSPSCSRKLALKTDKLSTQMLAFQDPRELTVL